MGTPLNLSPTMAPLQNHDFITAPLLLMCLITRNPRARFSGWQSDPENVTANFGIIGIFDKADNLSVRLS